MSKRNFEPIHPGDILLEEFLNPMGVSQYRLAKDINVPQHRISEIVQGKRAITADTALRFGRFFGMEAQFWLNLQARYDLLMAEDELSNRLKKKRFDPTRHELKASSNYRIKPTSNRFAVTAAYP